MTELEKKAWKEKKRFYLGCTLIFLLLIGFSFQMCPPIEKGSLEFQKMALSDKAEFKERHGKSTDYWVEFYFKEDPATYKIDGIDYKYLDYKSIEDSLNVGDIVKVGLISHEIFFLSRNGHEYTGFARAQYHKSQNRRFIRVIFVTGLVLSMVPLFFRRHPKWTVNGEEQNFSFGCLLFFGLIAAFFFVAFYIGMKFVSGSQFAE